MAAPGPSCHLARMRRLVFLLELARVEEVQREIVALARTARRLHQPKCAAIWKTAPPKGFAANRWTDLQKKTVSRLGLIKGEVTGLQFPSRSWPFPAMIGCWSRFELRSGGAKAELCTILVEKWFSIQTLVVGLGRSQSKRLSADLQ